MKFTTDRPFADPEKAAHRLMQHAHAFEPVDGRIYIEHLNGPFLFGDKGTPEEYKVGLDLAIERGWLVLHESGTFVRLTQVGADLFACEQPGNRALSKSPAGTVLSGFRRHRLPISEVVEPAPLVDRSAAHPAMKAAGVPRQLLFLARRVDRRAARAGEMHDQFEIGRHPPMMDLDLAFFQCG